ncbi:MAG: alanine--tRNA ligase, partial [Acidimicrobiales bacterium]
GIDGDRLWVTVHTDDDQAADIWGEEIGLPVGRIGRMGEDNFWEMGDTGPCGPCSEIYYDRGPAWGSDGGPAGGGGEERFVEIWNLVFPQYERKKDRSLVPLPHPGIDTGAGMERLLTIVEDVPTIWDTGVLRPLIARAESLTGRAYGEDAEVDVALRILADHARSVSFLIADGVFPSNEDRGYVLRRLIRRAVRQGYQLGVERPVMPGLVDTVVEVMGEAYPGLAAAAEFVSGVAEREEQRFRATLRSGLAMLEEELGRGGAVSGELAFRLHDTHGFPVELTQEIAGERGVGVDREGFDNAMSRQRRQSQEAGKRTGGVPGDRVDSYRALLVEHGPTRFVGYDENEVQATVLAVLDGGKEGVEVFLDSTPFYAEGGGQVGDTGTIETDSGRARVLDTTYALPGLSRHIAVLEGGEIRRGQVATAAIDASRRAAIRRNHTGTHLLHWALHEVLGPHVKQQGSLVAPDRLRFDFTHYGQVRPDELVRIEDLVNGRILDDEAVTISEMPRREADAAGAIAFFEEKYGEHVRVVRAGERSTELCGGTHVERLGQIGPLAVISEGSIGSNLRRIEATTGTATLERMRHAERVMADAAALLRARPDELTTAIERKLADLRGVEEQLRAAQQAALARRVEALVAAAVDGAVVARVDGVAPDQLRELAGLVRQRNGVRTAVLGGSPDGAKVALVALVARGTTPAAPDLIAPAARTVGGGGGGKNPEQAMAGGRDVSRLDEALDQIRACLDLRA